MGLEDFAIMMTKVTAGSWRQSSDYVKWVTLLVVVSIGYAVIRCQDVFSTYFPLQGSNLNSSNWALPASSKLHVEPPLQKLIDSIRQATETARTNSGSRFSFSAEDKDTWKEHNPCRSRQELLPMYAQLRRVVSNPQWELVLQEYATLHRTCTQAAGNLTEYFMARNESTGCKFFYSVTKNGLGNKVTHSISSFLYAVLTQRVLILPTLGHLPDVMCEPFEGSSWRLNYDLENAGIFADVSDVLRGLDSEKAGSAAAERIYASKLDNWWHPVSRVYCDTEQEYLSRVPLLGAHGALYYMPKLFAIPSFRPVLEAMFPDPSLTMTTLLRSAMLPGDQVWERFKSVRRAYLDNGDMQVGFQLRFFDADKYEELNQVVNSNIMNCSLLHGFLPDVTTKYSTSPVATDRKQKVIKVFIASLYMGLRNFLTSTYLRHLTVTGDSVSIVQLTAEFRQENHLEVDHEALVEILALSLSDNLFVTGVSTFGALAQGYGAIIPWYVNFDNDPTKPSCTRGQTIDTCYQGADERYKCIYEPELNEKQISDFVPYFKRCLSVDAWGRQLVNSNKTTGYDEQLKETPG